MSVAPGILTDVERATLVLACDALIGPVPRGSDPHRYWARRASDLGIPALIEAGLPDLPPELLRDFRRLLGLLDNPGAMLVLAGKRRRLREMRREEIERVLASWSVSRNPILRRALRALQSPATFLFYAAHAHGEQNPNWAALGYPGSFVYRSRKTRHVTPLAIEGDTKLSADAVVVGSGAGGSVVAAELAAAGWDVLLVERGPYLYERDFTGSEYEMTQRVSVGKGFFATSDLGVALLAASCLGGTTVVNWCTSLRAPDDTLERWARRHRLDLRGALPYESVERRLHVTTDFSHHNPPNQALADGCRALGYRVSVIPRNVRNCEEHECGWCPYGCGRGAKQSALVTYVEDAFDAGARIVVDCRVERVLTERGHVRGVEAVVGGRHRLTVGAPVVVLAAGTVGTSALLQASGLGGARAGRGVHLHPTVAVQGFYDRPMDPWAGPPQTAYCDEFADLNGGRGFWMEVAPVHPGLAGLGIPWTGSAQHKRDLVMLKYTAAFIVLLRDHDEGRVSLSRLSTPMVHYRLGRSARRMLVRGMQQAALAHVAAGARMVHTLQKPPTVVRRHDGWRERDRDAFLALIARHGVVPNMTSVFSAHLMGGAAMGGNAGRHVTNPEGRVYGTQGLYVADASVFPGPLGANPMLTIMAMAHRTAQFMKARGAR